MRIVTSSDWRDGLPFEVPVLASEAAPGDATRCFVCGSDSAPLERTELWAVKHRHPKQHAGYVRFYCVTHRPAPVRPPATVAAPATAARRRSAASAPRESAPRRSAPSDVVRAMCPNCFVEVSATGECGICGTTVS